MKAIEQYFHVVLFIMLHKVVLTRRLTRLVCTSVKPWCVTIQVRAIEHYIHGLLFTLLYKLIVAYESMDEALVCDHLNELKASN